MKCAHSKHKTTQLNVSVSVCLQPFDFLHAVFVFLFWICKYQYVCVCACAHFSLVIFTFILFLTKIFMHVHTTYARYMCYSFLPSFLLFIILSPLFHSFYSIQCTQTSRLATCMWHVIESICCCCCYRCLLSLFKSDENTVRTRSRFCLMNSILIPFLLSLSFPRSPETRSRHYSPTKTTFLANKLKKFKSSDA